MTRAEIYQWMTNPSLLNKTSLIELKQMVDDYPYFHAARILYLKNLAVLNDVRLDKELKRMSIFIPNRSQLFMLIKDEQTFVKPEETNVEISAKSEPIVTEENTVKPDAVSIKEKNTAVPSPTIASDYVNWLEGNAADIQIENGEKARLNHQDLIDSFIENENKQNGKQLNRMAFSAKTTKKNIDDEDNTTEQEPFEKESIDDSYFTETLARVYVNQKRYDKALEIIRVLSLKYPEKNIYFADQIRYLEKIINIKK